MAGETAITQDPIKHVVMLILENRSFDQMLGAMREVYPDLDGIDPARPRFNKDDQGNTYEQSPTTERQMMLDPRHQVSHVATQLENGNSGFVRDFQMSDPDGTRQARQFIMSYYPLDFLPALHTLARNFTVCDRWHSSVPGPTWPNRFFALSGTSCGRVNMPGDGHHLVDIAGWFEQDQSTIFDRLNEAGIHWKSYFRDIAQTWVMCHQRAAYNASRYFLMDVFFEDARGHEAEFPQFCMIEPTFMGADENDDHPPHDVMQAQQLVADVYNALRANPALWESTLLVVFYDEHGGFYDHVSPPAAVPPDDRHEEFSFDRLGVRVPALLVSPWTSARVEHTLFDHTSLLRYLIDKWNLGPLGQRAAQANSLGVALRESAARTDTPARIELSLDQLRPPDPIKAQHAADWKTEHHQALHTMTRYIHVPSLTSIAKDIAHLPRIIERISGKPTPVSSHVDFAAVEPDRISRENVALRDDFAIYLRHLKHKSLAVIAAKIRDPKLPEVQRRQAVQTLALLSGRAFHREPDGATEADKWLKAHGL